METCIVCTKKVYLAERLAADKAIYHKACFRCEKCAGVLKLGSYASMEGRTFCKPCFKKNFFTKGNYSEGFGKLKPQQEFDLKSGKAVSNGNDDSQDEEEKKRQDELKKRKDEEMKRIAEQAKSDAQDTQNDEEKRKQKSQDFQSRAAAFTQEKQEEKAKPNEAEEERKRIFDEARKKREESARIEKEQMAASAAEKKTEVKVTSSTRENFFLKNDQNKSPVTSATSSPVDRATLRGQFKSYSPAVTTTTSPSSPAKNTTTAGNVSRAVNNVESGDNADKKRIATLEQELKQARETIQSLEKKNQELQQKLDAQTNDNAETTAYKELQEAEIEVSA